ncbi:LTA synthase family protein [bacterium]|nr:LTA synthase family protein [bacterium]
MQEFWRGSWEPIVLALLLTLGTGAFNKANGLSVNNFELVLCTFGAWLLISAPTLFLSPRPRRFVLALLAALGGGVLIANQVYFRYYHDVITTATLMLAGQVYGVRESILAIWQSIDLLFFLPVLVFLGMGLAGRAHLNWTFSRKLRVTLVMAGSGATMFLSGYLPTVQGWNNDVNWSGNYPFVQKIGLFAFHIFDFQRLTAHKSGDFKQDPESIQKIVQVFEKRTLHPNALTGIGEGMNLITLQLESFESFPVGMTIDGQEITPNLNRIAKESLYFPNVFYQTARGNTSDAEFMLLNSILPLRDASINWLFPENDFSSLPLRLERKGYTSLAFHAYNKIYWNRVFMYPSLGFKHFYNQDDFVGDDLVNLGLSDTSFYEQSMNILKKTQEPFFAHMVSLTSHLPFYIPNEYRELSLKDTISTELQDYLHSVHYADKAVGVLLRALKDQGLDKRTAVVIYGDHEGISLKHYKEVLALKGQAREAADEWGRSALQTIPLIIHVPGMPVRGTFERVAGQIDIMPTLVNIMGVHDQGLMLGQDLMQTPRGPSPLTGRYPLGSFVDENMIFLASPDGVLESGTLFNRKTGEKLDTRRAEAKLQEVLRMYEVSQQVIKYNLINRLQEHVFVNREIGSSAKVAPKGS